MQVLYAYVTRMFIYAYSLRMLRILLVAYVVRILRICYAHLWLRIILAYYSSCMLRLSYISDPDRGLQPHSLQLLDKIFLRCTFEVLIRTLQPLTDWVYCWRGKTQYFLMIISQCSTGHPIIYLTLLIIINDNLWGTTSNLFPLTPQYILNYDAGCSSRGWSQQLACRLQRATTQASLQGPPSPANLACKNPASPGQPTVLPPSQRAASHPHSTGKKK